MKMWVAISIVLFLGALNLPGMGKTFCPACPSSPQIAETFLEKIVILKSNTPRGEEITILCPRNGTLSPCAILFFDPQDFSSQRVLSFLESFQERYPNFFFFPADLNAERAREIKALFTNLFHLPEEQQNTLPLLFVDGQAFAGEKEIVSGFATLPTRDKENPSPPISDQ
ncbi:MAG: hypothetical protein ACUVQZ_06920 [Candidatus Caldatribacteriaceae bacterium]